ncbi:MAG: hypothetical protein U9P63_01530 [Patescibacteria group bacterium]|nr:hypothetical protein [Patescibacteria group bacterium]
MDFTKDIADVREELSNEKLDKQVIENFLKDVESEHNYLTTNLKKANSESAGRRVKIGELEQVLEENKIKIEKLSDNTELENLKQETEKYKQKYSAYLDARKNDFVKDFETISKSKNFDKIKDKLVIPLKDEKLNIKELNEDDLENNISKIKEYKDLGIFEDSKKNSFSGNVGGEEPIDYDNIDIYQMAKDDPEKAEEILKKKGY